MNILMLTVVFPTLTLSAVAFGSEPCSEKPIRNRDFSGVQNFVEEGQYESIECFLNALPEDIRAFRTYSKNSLSLQDGDLMNPRAIIADKKGGVFLTFNGDESQRGYDEVELIALNDAENPSSWVAASIKQVNGRLKVVQDNRCSSCHGNPIRPIWQSYPKWNSLYGEHDDWMPDPDDIAKDSFGFDDDYAGARLTQEKIDTVLEERKNFLDFRNYAKGHSRYSALEKASVEGNPVYPYSEGYRNRNQAFRPNLVMGSVSAARQIEILKNRVSQSEFYSNYKNTVLFYTQCKAESEQEEQVENWIDKEISTYSGGKYKVLADQDRNWVLPLILSGLKSHELTLHLLDDYLSTKYSSEDVSYWSGDFSIARTLVDSLAGKHLTQSNPEYVYQSDSSLNWKYDELEQRRVENPYTSFFDSKYFGQDLDEFIVSFYPQLNYNSYANDEYKQRHKEICEILLGESLEELGDLSPYYRSSEVAEPELTIYPQALSSCVECHETKSIGPRIPFSDPSSLDAFEREGLISLVEYMVNSDQAAAHMNGLRMPFGREPLEQEELDAIKIWIKQD